MKCFKMYFKGEIFPSYTNNELTICFLIATSMRRELLYRYIYDYKKYKCIIQLYEEDYNNELYLVAVQYSLLSVFMILLFGDLDQ